MNTPFDALMTWTAPARADLGMCFAILGIWLASAALPADHPSQVHLRNAIRIME